MKAVVIGAGRMGKRHVQVVRNLKLDLVGLCDRDSTILQAAGKELELGSDRLFSDVKTMLFATRPELVVVATTAPTHCQFTCLAAERGAKFVLCEKPMAPSLAECDQMITTCKATGTKLAVNHQMRFMEQYTEPKRILNSVEYGGVTSVTVVGGNFGMAMNGSHYFEMFRYVTDEAPATAQAWFSNEKVANPRGAQFEDRAGSVRLTTASGKRFYMEIGSDQGHGMNVVYAGRNGRIFIDEFTGTLDVVYREEQHRSLPTTRYGMPWVALQKKITPADAVMPTEAVLKSLLSNEAYPTGEHGRLAVATLVAAYLSNESENSAIPIDDKLPFDRIFPWA